MKTVLNFAGSLLIILSVTSNLSAQVGKPRPLADKIYLDSVAGRGVAIIYGKDSKDAGGLVSEGIKKAGGSEGSLVSADNFNLFSFPGKTLVVLGNLMSNKVCDYLYRNLYTFEDGYYPNGPDGYVVRCLLDPLGKGFDIIVLGGSSGAGVMKAAEYFVKSLEKGADGRVYVKPYLKVELGKGYAGLQYFPWWMSGGRGPLNSASRYLRGGDIKDAQKYKEELFEYLKNPSHLFSYYGTMLWELMEQSGVFSDAERLEIANKLLAFLRSDEGYNYENFRFYIKEWQQKRPDVYYNRVVGNHITRAGMGFYFGTRYFKKYFKKEIPEKELYEWKELLKNLWGSYLASYRNWDEAYSQHGFGGSLDNTLVIGLAEPEMSKEFFAKGLGRKMADYAFVLCNNMGKMPVAGDGGGICAPANLFSKFAYVYNDGRYAFMAGKCYGPSYGASTDEPIRGFFTGIKPVEPKEHLGVYAVAPFAVYPEPPPINSFDKISFRGGFDWNAPYLLIDGVGGYSHAYYDQNSIAEFSQNKFVWLCQPDQFFYTGLDFHNAATYVFNGLAPSNCPGIAALAGVVNAQNFSYSKTYLPDYGNAFWTRHVLFFRNDGPFLVLDTLNFREKGCVKVNFNWHILGEMVSSENGIISARQMKKDGTMTNYFGFAFPVNLKLEKSFSKDEKRRALMARIYVLSEKTDFNLVVLTRRQELLSPGIIGMLSAFQSLAGGKTPDFRIYQVDETAYLSELPGGLFLITAGEGPVTCGNMKIDAEFAAVSEKMVFLYKGKKVSVGDRIVFSSDKPYSGEYAVSDPETREAIRKSQEAIRKTQETIREPREETRAAKPVLKKKSIGIRLIQKLKRKILKAIREKLPFLQNEKRSAAGRADTQFAVSKAGEISLLKKKSCLEIMSADNGDKYIIAAASSNIVALYDPELNQVQAFDAQSEVLSLKAFDLNNDGADELLAGTDSGLLFCLDNLLKKLWEIKIPQNNFTALHFSLGGPKVKTLFVCRFQDDQEPVIFAGMGDSTVQAVSGGGKLIWNKFLEYGVPNCFLCDNFFDDGGRYLATAMGIVAPTPEIYVLDQGGNIISKTRLKDYGAGSGITMVAPVNNGEKQIVAGTSDGKLALLRPNDKKAFTEMWSFRLGEKISGIAVLDDGQNGQIILAASKSGFINAFGLDGKHLWFRDVGSPVADLTSGKPSGFAVAGLADGRILGVKANGDIAEIKKNDGAVSQVSVFSGKDGHYKIFVLSD